MSVVYGYVIGTQYTGTGELMVQVRIPNIHGPISQKDYQGQKVKNYTRDNDLPWYPSLLLHHMPNKFEVVCLMATNAAKNEFIVIGLTGGQYSPSSISVS